MAPELVRIAVIGLGNIGRRVLEILDAKAEVFRLKFGLEFIVVGAADSRGAAWDPAGMDLKRLIALKQTKEGAAGYPDTGTWGMTGLELLGRVDADVLVEASPVNLKDGEPGMSQVRQALEQGMHVVTANKGPLALAYRAIIDLAQRQNRKVLFSATVGGGLPSVNVGVRDLGHARIERVDALLNLTSHYVLKQMSAGRTFREAVSMAQETGHAEGDILLDLDGWDGANKLVIVANAVLDYPATLSEVRVAGIRGISARMLSHSQQHGNVILPLALAERSGDGYRLSVQPTEVADDHPLARLNEYQMGIVYYTDTNGTITVIIEEVDPIPSAGAVIRDLINLYRA